MYPRLEGYSHSINDRFQLLDISNDLTQLIKNAIQNDEDIQPLMSHVEFNSGKNLVPVFQTLYQLANEERAVKISQELNARFNCEDAYDQLLTEDPFVFACSIFYLGRDESARMMDYILQHNDSLGRLANMLILMEKETAYRKASDFFFLMILNRLYPTSRSSFLKDCMDKLTIETVSRLIVLLEEQEDRRFCLERIMEKCQLEEFAATFKALIENIANQQGGDANNQMVLASLMDVLKESDGYNIFFDEFVDHFDKLELFAQIRILNVAHSEQQQLLFERHGNKPRALAAWLTGLFSLNPDLQRRFVIFNFFMSLIEEEDFIPFLSDLNESPSLSVIPFLLTHLTEPLLQKFLYMEHGIVDELPTLDDLTEEEVEEALNKQARQLKKKKSLIDLRTSLLSKLSPQDTIIVLHILQAHPLSKAFYQDVLVSNPCVLEGYATLESLCVHLSDFPTDQPFPYQDDLAHIPPFLIGVSFFQLNNQAFFLNK